MLDFSRFGINIADNYDNIIGLDYGHGEVSAALWKLKGDNVGDKPKDLCFNTNDKHKIFTALFISNDGTCKIGDEAIGNKPGSGKLYTGFKARPSRLLRNELYPNDTRTKKELVQSFFREVINALYRYNEADLKGDNIILVGCPSGSDWLENDNDILYANLLYDGLDRNLPIVIMPESRAALIKVIKERGQINLGKGAVVFDFGSSTADSTYIYRNGKTALYIDTSEPLGASYIEQEMLSEFFGGKHRAETLKDENNARIDLRGIKETHYLSPKSELAAVVSFQDGVEARIVDESFMNCITAQKELTYYNNERVCVKGSWVMLCEEFFHKIRNLLRDKPVGTVLLTGGASRMPFILDLCSSVFLDAQIIIDNDPSYCVSRGLAWAGKTDFEAQKAFRTTLKAIRDYLSLEDYDTTHLINNIVNGIANGIYLDIHSGVVVTELMNWKDAKDNETPNDLCRRMNERFRSVIGEEALQNKMKQLLAEQIKNSQAGIIAIIDNHYKNIYGKSVPKDYQFAITDEMLNKFVHKLSNIKLSLNSSATVNQALGYFGWGQVAMDARCYPSDRTAKANRALYLSERVKKLQELCRSEIRFELRHGKGINYPALIDEIMQEFTPQIEEMVDSLALYFAR